MRARPGLPLTALAKGSPLLAVGHDRDLKFGSDTRVTQTMAHQPPREADRGDLKHEAALSDTTRTPQLGLRIRRLDVRASSGSPATPEATRMRAAENLRPFNLVYVSHPLGGSKPIPFANMTSSCSKTVATTPYVS